MRHGRDGSGARTTDEDLGRTDPTTPVVWHYGGQGAELAWKNGEPFLRDVDDPPCECTDDEYEARFFG